MLLKKKKKAEAIVGEKVVEPVVEEEEVVEDEVEESPQEEPKKTLGAWSVERIPIEERDMIYNKDENNAYTLEQGMVRILNILDAIE